MPTFREIYDREYGFVRSSLRRLGIANRHLDDVCHDVFVVVHRSLPTFDPARPLRPWLFAIAHRTASDFRRRAPQRREVLDEQPANARTASSDPERDLEHRRAWALVDKALHALDPDRRAIFVLHDIEQTPMPEIALALDVPLNTAYSRLRLARRDFQAAIRAESDVSEGEKESEHCDDA